MTYNVFSGTLNPTQSINQSIYTSLALLAQASYTNETHAVIMYLAMLSRLIQLTICDTVAASTVHYSTSDL